MGDRGEGIITFAGIVVGERWVRMGRAWGGRHGWEVDRIDELDSGVGNGSIRGESCRFCEQGGVVFQKCPCFRSWRLGGNLDRFGDWGCGGHEFVAED